MNGLLEQKIVELTEELRSAGRWKKSPPDWIYEFESFKLTPVDFFEWLQFVYLPNKQQHLFSLAEHSMIALQVKRKAAMEEHPKIIQLIT